jgi:hypothetical protein
VQDAPDGGRDQDDRGRWRPQLLEVGSGPGRLATTLATVAPAVRVTGVDIAPGGMARIYDLVGWILRLEQQGPDLVELARSSPFGDGAAITTRKLVVRVGPVPLIYRADLRREPRAAAGRG